MIALKPCGQKVRGISRTLNVDLSSLHKTKNRKRDVMSRELKILNGPSFRSVAFETGIFNENSLLKSFKMDKENPKGIRSTSKTFTLFISFIGRVTANQNEFVMLSKQAGYIYENVNGKHVEVRCIYYYVIHFNVVSRKGRCTEYTEEEFMSSPALRYMFQIPEPTSTPSLEERLRENGVLEAKPTK